MFLPAYDEMSLEFVRLEINENNPEMFHYDGLINYARDNGKARSRIKEARRLKKKRKEQKNREEIERRKVKLESEKRLLEEQREPSIRRGRKVKYYLVSNASKVMKTQSLELVKFLQRETSCRVDEVYY